MAWLLIAVALLGSSSARGQDEEVLLGALDLSIVGLDLAVAPPAQTVPRGVQTVRGGFGGSGVRLFGSSRGKAWGQC